MADTPQTLAAWVAHASVPVMQRTMIQTLIADNPLLGIIPMLPWPGGSSYDWTMVRGLPTIGAIDDTTTLYSSKSTYSKMRVYLSQCGGEVQIPVASNSNVTEPLQMEASEVTNLILAAGRHIAGQLFTGTGVDETAVTIHTLFAGTGNHGIDAVVAVSSNMPAGDGWLTYTHAGTSLKWRSPGSTTYGAATTLVGDGDYTMYDGDDATQFVTLTIDVSDFTGGAVNVDGAALNIPRPAAMEGLGYQSLLDTAQYISSTGATGDAITLATLDALDDMVLAPKQNKIFVMNPRTRRAVKTLIANAGGTDQSSLQNENIAKASLVYEGIPIFSCPDIAITESKGGASALTSVYCLNIGDPENGVHMFYGPQNGPNEGTMSAVSEHSVSGPITLPVYLRRLPEMVNSAYFKWRLTASLATVLKRSKSCARAIEITS